MNLNTYIYSLEYPKGNIRYIGKANNPQRRFNDHLSSSLKRDKITKNSNWIYSLLIKGEKPIINMIDKIPIEEWQFWEVYYISLYKSWGFDLNNGTFGGDGVNFQSKENRLKISNGVKDAYDSGKLAPWNKGKEGVSVGWKKGKSRKKEDGEKTSKGLKEYYKTHDVWNKGKKTLHTPWNKGIKMSKEIVDKSIVNNPNRKVILQFDINGNFIKEWFSTGHIFTKLGLNKGNVHKACRGDSKSSGGYLWIYKDDYILNNFIIHNRVNLYKNRNKGKGAGKNLTELHKNNISIGRKNSNKCKGLVGRLNPTSKKVVQVDCNTDEVIKIYDSISEAKNMIGKGNIGSVCRDERRTANGFKWRY